jgi:hypothetical protein
VPSAGRDELLGSGSVSLPDWWGAGGRAGWLADGDLGTAPPWTLAGLVIGAWSIEAPARPLRALPWPGVMGAQEPLSWSDSVGIAAGRDAAWRGFDASLATASGGQPLVREPGDEVRARSDVTLTRGDHQMNDNGIGFSRGDTLRGLRIEAASGRRGPAGGIVAGGRDLYALAMATTRGAQRIEGSFSHRRSSAQLAGTELWNVRSNCSHFVAKSLLVVTVFSVAHPARNKERMAQRVQELLPRELTGLMSAIVSSESLCIQQ